MLYIKVRRGGESARDGGPWSLPTQRKNGTWKPGAWYAVRGRLQPGKNALHATDEAHLADWLWHRDVRAWVVEFHGQVHTAGDGRYYGRRARLLRPYPLPDWWHRGVEFANEVEQVPWLQPDGQPLDNWKVFNSKSAAIEAAVADGADREGCALTVWNAANDQAPELFAPPEYEVVGKMLFCGRLYHGDAIDAADDALAHCMLNYVHKNRPKPPELEALVRAAWEVWRKGYRRAANVGMTMYVYA